MLLSAIGMSRSVPAYASEELIEKRDRKIDLGPADFERGSEGNDVLVVAADVEHEAVFLSFMLEVAL
jgi:hypothetical protein